AASVGQLSGCSERVVGIPRKEHRLEVERTKLLVVQARRFVFRGEVVALALGRHQERCNAGFGWRENAQFDSASSDPGDILVTAQKDAGQALTAHPLYEFVVFGVQF